MKKIKIRKIAGKQLWEDQPEKESGQLTLTILVVRKNLNLKLLNKIRNLISKLARVAKMFTLSQCKPDFKTQLEEQKEKPAQLVQ